MKMKDSDCRYCFICLFDLVMAITIYSSSMAMSCVKMEISRRFETDSKKVTILHNFQFCHIHLPLSDRNKTI